MEVDFMRAKAIDVKQLKDYMLEIIFDNGADICPDELYYDSKKI